MTTKEQVNEVARSAASLVTSLEGLARMTNKPPKTLHEGALYALAVELLIKAKQIQQPIRSFSELPDEPST